MTVAQWNWVMGAVAIFMFAGFDVMAIVSLFRGSHFATCLGKFLLYVGLGLLVYAFAIHFYEPNAKVGSGTLHDEMVVVMTGILACAIGLTAIFSYYLYSRANKPKKQPTVQ